MPVPSAQSRPGFSCETSSDEEMVRGIAGIMSERQARSGRRDACRPAPAPVAACPGDVERPLAPAAGGAARCRRSSRSARPQPGIGKSIVACNLAASIAGLGRRVVVVDLDFRAPRQHAPVRRRRRPTAACRRGWNGSATRRDELAPTTRGPQPEAAAVRRRGSTRRRAGELRAGADAASFTTWTARSSSSTSARDNRDDLFDFFADERVPPAGHVARAAPRCRRRTRS